MDNTNNEQNLERLDDDNTGSVSGGFLIGDKHLTKTYKNAGIKIIKHTWKSNEFVINSTNRKISKSDANKIVDLYKLDCRINDIEKKLQAHINQEIKNGKEISVDDWYS